MTLQTGNSGKLHLKYTEEISEDQVKFIEKQIHTALLHRKIMGEWFDIPLENAILEIKYAKIRFHKD